MNRRLSAQPRAVALAATLTAVVLTATACGGDSPAGGESGDAGAAGNAGASTVEEVPEIAGMVPEAIASKGVLNVAAEAYPPAVIVPPSGGEPTGWEIETAKDLAAVLGLETKINIIPFDSIVPSLQAGRYDVAMGEIAIIPERTEVVSFVQSHVSTDAFMVPADSSIEELSGPLDVCGLSMTVLVGSIEASRAEDMSKGCQEAGKEPLEIMTFKDQASADLALAGGRFDIGFGSASQAAYVVEQTAPKFRLVEMPWSEVTPTGVVIADTEYAGEMAEAVKAAIDHLIETGRQQEILDEFNGGLGNVPEATIHPKTAA
jgi:polar amino acid transport system substrate-binding protein